MPNTSILAGPSHCTFGETMPSGVTHDLQHSLDPDFAHCKCPLSISVLSKPCIRAPKLGIMAIWPILPRGQLMSNWFRMSHESFLEPTVLLHDSESSAQRSSSPGDVTSPRSDHQAIWTDLTSQQKSALCGFLDTSSCSSRTIMVVQAAPRCLTP